MTFSSRTRDRSCRPGSDTSGTPEWDLDSQTIHSMAGGQLAQMIFHPARSLSDSNIAATSNRAVSDNGAAIFDISLGICERVAQTDGSLASDDQSFQVAIAQGQTFVVSTGDSGANECAVQGYGTGAPYPASSPYVIVAGGTTLQTDASGNYGGEVRLASAPEPEFSKPGRKVLKCLSRSAHILRRFGSLRSRI